MLYQRTDPEERLAVATAMRSEFGDWGPGDPSWQPSVYVPGKRSRPVAVFAAGLSVGALLMALVSLDIHPHHHHHHRRPQLIDLDMPPPPPPPSAPPKQTVSKAPEPRPAPQVFAPPPIVTPPVATPSPVAVSPVPVPVPVPPPPVPVAPAPPPAPAAVPAAPRTADGGDLSSKMIAATPPTYPIDSRRKHEQGTVVLDVLLDTDGSVSDLSVATSSGFDRLDHAALAAVRHWRWSPTIRDGAAVMVHGLVRIPFVLAG